MYRFIFENFTICQEGSKTKNFQQKWYNVGRSGKM